MFLRHRLQNAATGEGGGEGGGAGIPPSFETLIPQEYRGHPSLAPIKDMAGMVKSYISAQEMVGKNRIALPGDSAKPEEWGEFFNKLGRPESPDKYGLKKPDQLPEGFDLSDEFISTLGQLFHKHGLTAKQAQGFFQDYNEHAVKSYTEEAKGVSLKRQEEMANLQKEWGAAYDANIDRAKRAIRVFLGEDQVKWLDSNGLSADPNMIKVFANIGEKLSEPNPDTGGDGTKRGFGPLTPAQAQDEIAQKMADKEFMDMYMDKYHPRHAWAVEQMTRLHQFSVGNPQRAA